jgi:hypothetical protein
MSFCSYPNGCGIAIRDMNLSLEMMRLTPRAVGYCECAEKFRRGDPPSDERVRAHSLYSADSRAAVPAPLEQP